MIKNKKTAFTLMETLVTVVILGIVAAILVPNLINRQVENANRTRVKKAMASYEKAINFMIIENDIRTTEGIREFAQEDNCTSAKGYFKTVQNGANDCIFKTADRVWWNITDLTNPIIILKDSQLNKTTTELQTLAKDVNDKTVFSMVGRFDDLGTLRVNDNAYEQSQNNNMDKKKYVAKLWSFATNSTIEPLSEFATCKLNNQATCTIIVDGVETEYELVTITDLYNVGIYSYNRETNTTSSKATYSEEKVGDYYIKTYGPGTTSEQDAKDLTGSICTSNDCLINGDYWNAAKRKCESQGARLATVAEIKSLREQGIINNGSVYTADEYSADRAYGYGLNSNGFGVQSKSKNLTAFCIGE